MSQLSNEIQSALEDLNKKLSEEKSLNTTDMELLFITSLLEDESK